MKTNIKNIAVILCFIAVTFGFMTANIIAPDPGFLSAERRRAAAFPVFSFDNLLSGQLFEDFEKYALDQFVFRDRFRALKSAVMLYVFGQKDDNGMYVIDGYINKMVYPLNKASVLNAAKKLNEIYARYLDGMNVFYSVIPDKNYHVPPEKGFLKLDYEKMAGLLHQNVAHMRYIDIFDTLTTESYYYTDIHWRQEKIVGTADRLLKEMGNAVSVAGLGYTENRLYPFYGSYYSRISVKTAPDTMVYLTGITSENAFVYDYQTKTYSRVYMPEKFNGMDPYDVFMSGAVPLVRVENPGCPDKKELLLFRDSFASSIAPLLLEGYSAVTLIDLRYITTDLLDNYIDFGNQDVLFLYNTEVLNSSYMLK